MNYLHDVGVNLPECWLKYIDKTILDNVTSKLLIEIGTADSIQKNLSDSIWFLKYISN